MNSNLELVRKMDYLMLEAFQRASSYGEELFHAQPQPGKWSLQQVMHHIWFATNGAMKVMKNKMAKAESLPDATFESELRSIFLKFMLMLPLKFKAPKEVSMVPNDIPFDVLKAEWDSTIAGLSELVDEAKQGKERKLVFKHPVAGWFTLRQTLTFLLNHLEHHQKQLEGLYSWLDKKK